MKKLFILLLISSLFAIGPRKFIDGSESWYIINRGDGITISINSTVGIGTPTPSYKLDVVGTINATAFIGDGSELTNVTAALPMNVVTDNYSAAVTLDSTDNVLYGSLTGTASNADTLDSLDSTYFTNASNIDAGTLDKDFIDSEVVTQNYNGIVTVSALYISNSVTETIWIDPVYLDATRTPTTGELSNSLMEYLSFESGSSQNIKLQVEVPDWHDVSISPNLVLVYTVSANNTTATVSYTVGYNAIADGEGLTTSLTERTDTFIPVINVGEKDTQHLELIPVSLGDSLQISFERDESDGYSDSIQVLNFGVDFYRKRL